ncbi:MAG: hypothetical protein AAF387_09025 [Pseudomonadota bacterium]
MSYAHVFPHGDVEEIGNNIFMVRGSIKLNPVIRITRNMAVVRNGREISLINPVRVNDRVLKQIANIGEIKHLIRTGALHGVDDPYYVDNFGARMWSQPGGTAYTTPKIDVEISADTRLPFDDATAIIFEKTKQPECGLHIADGDGLLLTCDAIQNYGDYSYNNLLARMMLPFIGFPKKTLVGPIWTKLMTPEGESLESDVRKLLALPFNRLLAAHGTLLTSGAHAAVKAAIDEVFPAN